MPRLRWFALVVLLASISLHAARAQFVTQLFADNACTNLISSPIPRSGEECVPDPFLGTYYQTVSLNPPDNSQFSVSVGCSSCTVLNITAGECFAYGLSSSVKVEIAVASQALNASLFDSDTCTSFPQGYESVTIHSGECSAAAANGLFATVLEKTGTAPSDIIVGLACSTDCTFCGFYARGKPDTCIALPLPQFYGKLSFVSSAGALGLSIFAILFAVLSHL